MKPSIKQNYGIKLFINMDPQVCVIKTVAYRARTDTRTDKKVKPKEPKILSNYIFYCDH